MGLFDGVDFGDDEYPKSPVNREYENPGDDYDDGYENLDDKKTKEQIRKLQIENEKALRNLVEKDLMVAIIGEIGQSLKNNLVDQSKRRAYIWANQLGITSKERDIEKMIGEMIKEGIQGVKLDIERLCNDRTFE